MWTFVTRTAIEWCFLSLFPSVYPVSINLYVHKVHLWVSICLVVIHLSAFACRWVVQFGVEPWRWPSWGWFWTCVEREIRTVCRTRSPRRPTCTRSNRHRTSGGQGSGMLANESDQNVLCAIIDITVITYMLAILCIRVWWSKCFPSILMIWVQIRLTSISLIRFIFRKEKNEEDFVG